MPAFHHELIHVAFYKIGICFIINKTVSNDLQYMPVMVLCKNAQTRVNVCSILELQDVIALPKPNTLFIGHLIKAFRCKFYYSIKLVYSGNDCKTIPAYQDIRDNGSSF